MPHLLRNMQPGTAFNIIFAERIDTILEPGFEFVLINNYLYQQLFMIIQ